MTEHHDEAVEQLLRDQPRPTFGPGFADRVLRQVEAEQTGFLAGVMPAEFLRVATAAVLLAAALAAFSVIGSGTDGAQTTLEAMFGIQPLTADVVYDPTAVFFSEEGTAS